MMRRRLCAAVLVVEAIVLGLTIPVLIAVEMMQTDTALWIGLGLGGAAIITAGLLRFAWAYWIGGLLQIATVALGVLVTAMFALGAVFLALWVTAYRLGGIIDDDRAGVGR